MEGYSAHKLYFVQSGSVKTYKTNESGKCLVTGIFGTGQFIGQLSLITDKGNYKDTASVLEDAEIVEIPKTDFTTLLYSDKLISNKFITMISNDLLELEEKLVSMAFASVKQRLAKTLLQLHTNTIQNNIKTKGIHISREDLAGLMGTANETAIRMLTDFKDEGLVIIGPRKEIIITDKNNIEDIANFG
jgi:CRP-like cAMP-binding protein